jgi:hypothetical protein
MSQPGRRSERGGRAWGGRRGLAAAGLVLAGAILAAGCGSAARAGSGSGSPGRPAGPPAAAAGPLSTSLVTAQGTWAIAVMGGSAGAQEDFWQLFVRPAGGSRWSLVTPPGVADNGGLVAAGTGTSLLVGFRPSQALTFSPLAVSADTGRDWTPGLLDARLADVADALAAGPDGQALALRQDGGVETAATVSAAAAGQWSPLTTLAALAATTPGRECGLQGLQAVSFGPEKNAMTAGSCARPGVAGVFTDSGGTWRSAGLAVPAAYGRDQVQVLGLAAAASGNAALLRAGDSLLAAWSTGPRWTVSGPVPAGTVRASGFGAGRSAWLLLGDGRADTIDGPGGGWHALPAVPPGTATLAPEPGGGYDALAVSGSMLTVWHLVHGAWSVGQRLSVPIVYGSSS